MSRSMKSLQMPWYQRPLVKNNQYMNIQKGAIIMAIVGIVRQASANCEWIIQLRISFSSFRCSRSSLESSTCTVTQWRHRARLTTATTSSLTSSCTSAITTSAMFSLSLLCSRPCLLVSPSLPAFCSWQPSERWDPLSLSNLHPFH